MTFDELIQDFSGRIGFEDFAPDENGTCFLVSENSVITIQNCPDVKKVLVTAPIIELPKYADAAILRECLEANFMYSGTMGSTISLDGVQDALMLSTYFDLELLNGDAFYDAIMLFSTSLQKWQLKIGDMLGEGDGVASKGDEEKETLSGNLLRIR